MTAGIGDGCTTDAECKGNRICMDRVCVDPDTRAREQRRRA